MRLIYHIYRAEGLLYRVKPLGVRMCLCPYHNLAHPMDDHTWDVRLVFYFTKIVPQVVDGLRAVGIHVRVR